jgi:hypothetical protein
MSGKRKPLESERDYSLLPETKGRELLAILEEIDPISDSEKKYYGERVERFTREIFLRRLSLRAITPELLTELTSRLFLADEIADGDVDRHSLILIEARIFDLYLTDQQFVDNALIEGPKEVG